MWASFAYLGDGAIAPKRGSVKRRPGSPANGQGACCFSSLFLPPEQRALGGRWAWGNGLVRRAVCTPPESDCKSSAARAPGRSLFPPLLPGTLELSNSTFTSFENKGGPNTQTCKCLNHFPSGFAASPLSSKLPLILTAWETRHRAGAGRV